MIIEPGVTKSAIFAKSPGRTEPHRRLSTTSTDGCSSSMRRGSDAKRPTPFEVARVIHRGGHRRRATAPVCLMSWGAREIVEGRERMSDRDWVELRMALG